MSALIEVAVPGLCALIVLTAAYIGIVLYEADQKLRLRDEDESDMTPVLPFVLRGKR